jgi:farnesyl diphosphate synthase
MNMPLTTVKPSRFDSFLKALHDDAELVNEEMERLLPLHDGKEARLIEAMRYSALGPGKKLRPFLVISSAKLFGVSASCALRVAAAAEFLHCYSLIHDDLPAMDNSPLRRGLPSCHLQFDEATAILAGDALLTYAFEILSHETSHSDPAVRCRLIQRLAEAAGSAGMVGGQMLDMESDHESLNIGSIARLQRLKTGALFAFSCEAGGILGKAPQQLIHALGAYANDLGLAYQITDDLLDAESSEDQIGKPVRRDFDVEKPTYVSLLGIERARRQAEILVEQAIAHLEVFDEEANLLRDAAHYMIERKN